MKLSELIQQLIDLSDELPLGGDTEVLCCIQQEGGFSFEEFQLDPVEPGFEDGSTGDAIIIIGSVDCDMGDERPVLRVVK